MKSRALIGRRHGRASFRGPGRVRHALFGLLAGVTGWNAAAGGPQGMQVQRGTVNATRNGARTDITASHNAVINWQSFNIGAGESVNFHQPNSVSVVWNRILDTNPSQIWGSLNANGIVVLMNQSGFYFGPNSYINVGGGFIATTAPIAPTSPIGGGMWQYSGNPPAASIINYGEVRTGSGGSLFLVAERIENHGVLAAPEGTLGLYAGKEVLLSERPDGRGISARVRLPEGSIDNMGKLIADGGTLALHAQVVNNNGIVQADSVREHNGVIEFVASESIHLGPQSQIQARGDSAGSSDGGTIRLQSAIAFADEPGSKIEVTGGAQGGNGGSVELSAPFMSSIHSQLDGRAAAGWLGGRLFFDPTDIILTSSPDGSGDPSGTVGAGDSPGATLRLNVNSAFANFSEIHLQATHDISLEQGTVWNLNDSTGISTPGSMLTLEAGNNIVFADSARIIGGPGWSLRLAAGVDFNSPLLSTDPDHAITRGVGSIYFNGGAPDVNGARPNGSGAIETSEGDLRLVAGHEILVGGGFIRTTGGGNISITTGDGDVDAGNNPNTYSYPSAIRYQINPAGLGGIGTAAGGNVTIDSGRDILAFIGSIGAFGSSGDVSLSADRDIKGRFMLRNGLGTVQAGQDIGSGSSPASFGLASGGWNMNATRDLFLNEVYNPNGSLNARNFRINGVLTPFVFDYAPDAFVHLTAGNSVQLLGNDLAHQLGNNDRPVIYAPQLSIEAGAGGVVLGNDVILAPSPLGSLSIHTTDGGSLRSAGDGFFQLITSDSGSASYKDFASGHAATPLHLNRSDTAMRLDISGNIENIFIRSASRADIVVRGNAKNFSFEGQNLSPNDGRDNAPLFTAADFTDLLALAMRLELASDAQHSTDPISVFLRTQLADATLATLHRFLDSTRAPADHSADQAALQAALVEDFNRVIGGGSIYDPLRFMGASLTTETLMLIVRLQTQPPTDQPGAYRLLLNRMLLEDVYAGDLARNDHVRRPFDDTPDNNPNGNYSGIWIHGDFTSRSDRTFVTVDLAPNALFTLFNPLNTRNAELGARFSYNERTHRLEFQGIMTEADVRFLLEPTVYRIDGVTGELARDAHGMLIVDSVAPIFSAALLNDLALRSADIPTSPLAHNGLQIGGPGQFQIAAHYMDLGISAGIRSVGLLVNPSLASVANPGSPLVGATPAACDAALAFKFGSDLRLDFAGDLNMASSQIASFSGGSIDATAAGRMDVGSSDQFTSDDTPKGIYTGHGGHVYVQASGDIDINGSRIATYDGGDISVISDHGDINAGSGGKGFFTVSTAQINIDENSADPAKCDIKVTSRSDKFFGSGIVALTRVDGEARVGDIFVSAGALNPPPNHHPGDGEHEVTGMGSILANAGGILQLAFNKVNQSAAKVILFANGSIEANQSGILGGNVNLKANEGIEGLVVAQGNLDLHAQQNVSVTALAGGTANVTGGGTVSGIVAAGGGATVGGGEGVNASVISANSGGSAFASVAAPVATQTTTDDQKKAATAVTSAEEDEETKRKAKGPMLAKTAGRVTVILPQK